MAKLHDQIIFTDPTLVQNPLVYVLYYYYYYVAYYLSSIHTSTSVGFLNIC